MQAMHNSFIRGRYILFTCLFAVLFILYILFHIGNIKLCALLIFVANNVIEIFFDKIGNLNFDIFSIAHAPDAAIRHMVSQNK